MNILILLLMANIASNTPPKSIHDFQIQALDSEEIIDFKNFEGKKVLVVNVASKCGFTGQYEGLEKLYQQYKGELVIVGFPCNQFLGQEPGSEETIAQFCSTKYGVSFPMTSKVKVKGKEAHPIYQWLTKKELNGKDNYKVSWNFNKFLLDEKGQIIAYFGSRTKPMDEAIIKHL